MRNAIVLSCLIAFVVASVACAALPWCKDSEKWTARLEKAAVMVQESRQAAEALKASGTITEQQYLEIVAACDVADTSIKAARAALSLCIRRIGAPDRAETDVTQAEADSLSADGLAKMYRSAVPAVRTK